MKWLYMFVFLCVCVRLCFMFIWRTLTFLSYHCIDDMSDSFFCGDDKRCRLCGIVLHSIHHEFNENVWWELLFHFKKCNFSHFSYQNWSLHKAWTNFRDCDVTFENNSEFNKRSQKKWKWCRIVPYWRSSTRMPSKKVLSPAFVALYTEEFGSPLKKNTQWWIWNCCMFVVNCRVLRTDNWQWKRYQQCVHSFLHFICQNTTTIQLIIHYKNKKRFVWKKWRKCWEHIHHVRKNCLDCENGSNQICIH